MNNNNKNKNEVRSYKSKILNELAPYSTLGIQLVLTVALCTWLGWLIDEKWETEPIFFIIMSFVGAIVGMVNFIRTVTKKKKK